MSFADIQKKIAASQNLPMGNAGAILAATSRNASPTAKKKNPALNRVKGKSNYKGVAARMLAQKRGGK